MKITSTFHVVFCLVVLLTLSTPLIAFGAPDPTQPAEPHRQAEPVKQADTTAEQNPEPTQPLSPAEALKMQAIADAQKDVEVYINKPMWFMLGCMFPVFGLVGPYIYFTSHLSLPEGWLENLQSTSLTTPMPIKYIWKKGSFVMP